MALAGKKVLVTGGKRSIGRGIALAMAEAGADVAINDLEEDEDARETLRLLAAAGGAGARLGLGRIALSLCIRCRSSDHFTPDLLTCSVSLFLKRQCDRTLGALRLPRGGRDQRRGGRGHVRRLREAVRPRRRPRQQPVLDGR
jgi:hypothetical protein